VGKTLENMREHLGYDKNLQTFLKDQKIEDAYQELKPKIDELHEEFINDALGSEEAKKINFSEYLEKYAQKDDDKGEKKLREKIGESFVEAGKLWKEKKYTKYAWKKGSKVTGGSTLLSCQDMLQLVKDKNANNDKLREMIDETFKGFFTYLSGFNQNRENYYSTKDEKATAIATRIIHENLPKFCDNLLQFECIVRKKKDGSFEKIERKEEYLNAHKYLKSLGRTTEIKDAKSGKMIELEPISEEVFKIDYFNDCLSQPEIEEYNIKIGHYNAFINLYNQAKRAEEKDLQKDKKSFRDLPKFKTLFKQIGCGKSDPLFFSLTHDTTAGAKENKENHKKPYSVEQVLELAIQAGEKYFQEQDDAEKITIQKFKKYVLEKENYEGLYWSKVAMNSISNKYFDNYHDLKDRLKIARVFEKANKGSEDDVKIPEAIELSTFFEVLDESEDWEVSFFKKSILKDGKKNNIIQDAKKPSEALLKMIFSDISQNAQKFLDSANFVLKSKDYKSEEGKERIKTWMDHALAINQMLKYFLVKENKIKGHPLDSEVSEMLKELLFEAKLDDNTEVNWFQWYDALRNYLTKKPQDDAKENKLKLNFENGSLLGGWSDGQEKSKASVLLNDGDLYYLGILKKKSAFSTEEGKESDVYENPTTDCGRLILANLKFQTLAGKGFLGEFRMSYGNMGKGDPQEAIQSLQKIIKDRYVKKYPLLQRIAETQYFDKKAFDKDIQETLKECYVCKFTPIDWDKVQEYVSKGEMYLFEISSKDNGKGKTSKKNMQTLYWNAVFEGDTTFQLNGGGEIFYRKQAIKEKKIKKGYEEKPWVIENKRFTSEDGKFFFHCPIKLNYKSTGNSNPKYALSEVNNNVNYNLSPSPNLHFLGIDRGEKHLAYYSLVNQNGEIVDQGTLNLPFVDKDGKPRSITKEKFSYNKKTEKWEAKSMECWDYNDLLDAMASNRDMARKNWQTIGTIKETKNGYVSQVVRTIADLATNPEKPAFIVLEDLNTGFKRGRQKIEKSVYQKFELALAKKLNFLVDKKAKLGEIGSATNALQLTPPVQNYSDIENKKQVGIMLYTRANYTSQTDSATGWRKSIYLYSGSEEYIKAQIIGGEYQKKTYEPKFSDIYFDGKDYVFKYEKGKVKNPKTDEKKANEWQIYSGKDGISLDRFRGKRGKDKYEWKVEKIDIVEILDGIFENFDKNRSLLNQVKEGNELKKFGEHTAWESLRFAIDLIQQIRNTGIEGDERNSDFILSPVRGENGKHFDSREYWDKEQKGEKVNMPSSGDANGAYNIARKGLIMNEHIKAWTKAGKQKYKDNQSDLNLFVSDEEWDIWLLDRNKWNVMVSTFASRKKYEELKSQK